MKERKNTLYIAVEYSTPHAHRTACTPSYLQTRCVIISLLDLCYFPKNNIYLFLHGLLHASLGPCVHETRYAPWGAC